MTANIYAMPRIGRMFRSAHFRRGFVEGFSAPVLLFWPAELRRDHLHPITIEAAWDDVQDSLCDAVREFRRYGKTASQKQPEHVE